MAYFIVIGTNDKVNGVVDEIAKSHQPLNTVSSGCITTKEDGGLLYKWTALGDGEERNNENSCSLKDMLTNHLANFRTILPMHETPKVMLVSNCMDDEDEERLEWMLEELLKTEGNAFAMPQIDVVLIAYDLSNKHDVVLRPHWRILKKVKGLLDRNRPKAKLLHINNMDYGGAATYVGDKLLGRFLGHWGKMADAGCRRTINSDVYSIGLAEYQYNFEDLKEYFELDTERALLERKLNAQPSSATQSLLDKKRCLDIDTKLPWLDGLKAIKSTWSTYCDTKYDFSIPSGNHVYCLEKQKKRIVSYLHGFLKIYVDKCNKEITECKEELAAEESILHNLIEQESETQNQIEMSEQESSEELRKALDQIKSDISKQNGIIERINSRINYLQNEIANNAFKDADEIALQFDPAALVTDEERDNYEAALKRYDQLESYVQSDEGAKLIKKTILESVGEQCTTYPRNDMDSIGRLEEVISVTETPTLAPTPKEEKEETSPLSSRKGCAPWSWFLNIFGNSAVADSQEKEQVESEELKGGPSTNMISQETAKEAGKAINALKSKIPAVKEWWNSLLSIISYDEKRLEECIFKINSYGDLIPNHRKSRTLIDKDLVDSFRQSDNNYKKLVQNVLATWFDSTLKKRPSLNNLIDEKVLVPLRSKYSILAWDNTNPFVKENLSDADIHQIVEHVFAKSKPFVQYENIDNNTIKNQIADYFFFNNLNIEQQYVPFRNKYSVASGTLCPKFLPDFYNSLCAVQVMEIKDPITDIKDFTPKRETPISTKPQDPNFDEERRNIIGDAQTPINIARRIYDWLCDNIQYDTTKSIHDADTCWRTKKGVCQAYCELFCHIAGDRLNLEVVGGKCKMPDGNISETSHAWLYVYTDGYKGIFIDPTWGAGGINDGRFVQSVNRDTWFDVDPAWMIFSHYPENGDMKMLDYDISEEQFKQLPILYPNSDKKALDELSYYLDPQI